MRGRLGYALATAACLAALVLPAVVSARDRQPVKDGYYAGGSSHGVFVFFDVSTRKIPYVRVYSDKMGSCTGLGGPAVFDLEGIDAKGRFKLMNDTTFPGNEFVVKGRFTSSKHAEGTVKWTTTSDCPAGAYEFGYRVDRYGP